MATMHPATSYEVGKRVGATLKGTTTELKAKIIKIIGDKNLLKIVPEEGEDRAGEEINVNADRCRKLRGPAPGTTRGPNKAKEAAPAEEVEDGAEDEVSEEGVDTQTSGKFGQMSLEDLEAMLNAHTQMADLIKNAIADAKKTKPAAPEKKNLMARRRPMAEDETE